MNEHSKPEAAPESGGSDSNNLLPCPFCGEPPIDYAIDPHEHNALLHELVQIPDHPGSHWIECPRCDIHMGRESLDEARDAWNSRAG